MGQFNNKIFLAFILILFFEGTGWSQQKFEKETRIKEKEVPERAVSFLDSMSLSKKVKWIKETGFNTISYEAKTRFQGDRISIEFSENGDFEDIELQITSGELPSDTYSRISDYLGSEYEKFSFEKVQIQYSGNKNEVLDFFLNRKVKSNIVRKYEVVISTRLDGSYVMFEYLFSDKGKFLQKSRIVLKMTDNIVY
ncbi:hypothetical protein [Marinilabilia sp.]